LKQPALFDKLQPQMAHISWLKAVLVDGS